LEANVAPRDSRTMREVRFERVAADRMAKGGGIGARERGGDA
jgi:hypothetical protein